MHRENWCLMCSMLFTGISCSLWPWSVCSCWKPGLYRLSSRDGVSINSTGTLKTVSARSVDVLFVSCLFFKFQFSVSVSFIFLHYFPRKDVGVGRLCPKQGLSPYPLPDPPGAPNKVLYGEAPPQSPTPYPFIYHFWQKRYPFRIPSIEKWHPFHIPT